ncbi:hypothetical protein [Streptomyces sp. G45]|uniref:hypothetical protein n=1 Tax=Streptomyces sp. G45 TaxID=3406627 RepID=UPI003C158554
MHFNGADQQRGHLLLIAGDIAARRRTVQVEPSANLAALSLVPVPVLLATDAPADTTYLDGPRDQNALLMKLRTAAATPGPLLVYLSGRLTVDRRSQRPYLALPGTTAATTRYTALPWEWLGTELRNRPAGWTTVVFDVAADKGAWELVGEGGTLPALPSAEAYGVITPPAFSGHGGVSPYTQAWIEQLRSDPRRPANSTVHALTIATASLPPGTVILPLTPQLGAPPAEAQRTKPNPRRLIARDTGFLPRRRRPEPAAPARTGDGPGVQDAATTHLPPHATHQRVQEAHHPVRSTYRPQTSPDPAPQPRSAPVPYVPQQPAAVQAPPAPAAQLPAPVQASPTAAQQHDPRPYIAAAAQAGRHEEAAQTALAWEQHAQRTHGPHSPQATQWTEIRADLAKMSGDLALAAQLWIAAARDRLAHQSPHAPEALNAARSAHYCWTQITDPSQARATGPELIDLLRQLPGLDPRQLPAAQQHLESLNNAPSEPTTPTGRS